MGRRSKVEGRKGESVVRAALVSPFDIRLLTFDHVTLDVHVRSEVEA